MEAIWNGVTIAKSDNTIIVEGNHYFPSDSVNEKFLNKSTLKTICNWKGTASYFNIVVDGNTNKNAAWYYPAPRHAAKPISGYVAFWNGVKIKPNKTKEE